MYHAYVNNGERPWSARSALRSKLCRSEPSAPTFLRKCATRQYHRALNGQVIEQERAGASFACLILLRAAQRMEIEWKAGILRLIRCGRRTEFKARKPEKKSAMFSQSVPKRATPAFWSWCAFLRIYDDAIEADCSGDIRIVKGQYRAGAALLRGADVLKGPRQRRRPLQLVAMSSD